MHDPGAVAAASLRQRHGRRAGNIAGLSSASSATTSLRSTFTSSPMAARAVSPASRFLPASGNSFDPLQ
ncbi:hypothetical protein BG36_05360 [Aquamicrobium defluvii]|uniref:Uncharacterized protein n=1 Tax=Aquamicrobium defluvii TaxID=69279 RepID=A0A011VEK3_9HYPH|nr:hypothetical protein BG36_05360 [Aquamicrobium defluvii]EZQ15878.1 hypothetical protein CF98_09370 [Halopseudomonas bauzanensis]